jgi:competence ComEA-like helix-hairpin-helix protein
MKWIKQLSLKFGFTESELKVLLFVIIVFTVGILAYYIKYKAAYEEYKIYDYSVSDSLFGLSDSAALKSKKSENLVDSERELLDFRAEELSNRHGNNKHLSEKSIDLNSADVNLLCSLPGIGIKTAEKIISLRNKKGSFNSIEELLEVKGIGQVKLERIKKYLFVK